MTLRTDHIPTANPDHPIRFDAGKGQSSLAERIIAAARVASAMHLTGAALISADEAALLALGSEEVCS